MGMNPLLRRQCMQSGAACVQGSQHSESRKVAEDMLKGIAPSLGPLLSVPSDFASSHVS